MRAVFWALAAETKLKPEIDLVPAEESERGLHAPKADSIERSSGDFCVRTFRRGGIPLGQLQQALSQQ
jgi:hypothetical protein